MVAFPDPPSRRLKPRESARQPRAVLPAAETGARELGDAITIAEAARLIGCSPWTVRQTLIPQGLPCLRCGRNGKLIFYRNQVTDWIVRRQRARGGHP